MKPNTKTWLARLSGLLILAQSTWAVIFYASQRLDPGETFGSLFLAPGIYLVEIAVLAAAAALLPWLKLKSTPRLLWVIAGIYAAFALADFWTVGYYLSPSFILALVDAAYLSSGDDRFSWPSFRTFAAAALAQFIFALAPFIKRFLF
jgi:hypothetical protein